MLKKGFTLIELAIVLVIIGLLIGGILVAQSMILTSKVNAQIRQLQQFDVAITNFKQKYNQIPGDCGICLSPNPINYGNGNGKLESRIIGGPPTLTYAPPQTLYKELLVFFVHLYNFGSLTTPYVYTGYLTFGEGGLYPDAKIGRGGVFVTSSNDGATLWYSFLYRENPSLTVGGSFNCLGPNSSSQCNDMTQGSNLMGQGNFSAVEAMAIDKKLDDGLPGSGNVVSVQPTWVAYDLYPMDMDTTTCTSSGDYKFTSSATNLCNIAIKSESL